jgi:hypothetical protein
MKQEEKELLRIEYYKVMEYSQPFGNEHHEELFEWFILKLQKQRTDIVEILTSLKLFRTFSPDSISAINECINIAKGL